MKKESLIILVFVILTNISNGNTWQWVRHVGSDCPPNHEYMNSLITDGTNSYIIGEFFGCLYLPDDTLYSNGFDDIYISKLNGNGDILWTKQIGGSNFDSQYHESASGVYDSINHCIYIAGTFKDAIQLGGTVLNNFSSFATDIFLTRMDLDGNFIWANQVSGPGIKRDPKVYVNNKGKIYLITESEDSIRFENYHISPGGSLAQYNPDGSCVSARELFTAPIFTNQNNVQLNFIGDDLLIHGTFRSNPFHIDTASLIPKGSSDGFIARADSIGNIKWLKTFGYTGKDYLEGLTLDEDKNIFITGVFEDSINLGGVSLYNNNSDIYVAKFDSSCNIIWIKQFFATGFVSPNYIKSDLQNNVYISGSFSGTITLGSSNVTTFNTNDMFLTRFSANGNCMGSVNFGNGSGDYFAIDANENITIGGYFSGIVDIGTNTLFSYEGLDIYLGKIDGITGIANEERLSNNKLIIYANPNVGKCTITIPDEFLHEKNLILTIYDASGKLIQQKDLSINEDKIKLNLEQESKGIYNIILSNKNKNYRGKIVFD